MISRWSRRADQDFLTPRGSGRVESDEEVLKSRGLGPVRSGRVGSSRVKRLGNLAGRVGS